MSNVKADPGTNCDWCWDEKKVEVAATVIHDGVSLCIAHSNLKPPTKLEKNAPTAIQKREPNSVALDVIKLGIDGDKQFMQFLHDLMKDVTAGSVTPEKAKTICAVADRMIKLAELKLKLELSKRR